MVVDNVHNDTITVGGDAVLGLLHEEVAAGVEGDIAPSGALDLDMGAIHVGGVDEGARKGKRGVIGWVTTCRR